MADISEGLTDGVTSATALSSSSSITSPDSSTASESSTVGWTSSASSSSPSSSSSSSSSSLPCSAVDYVDMSWWQTDSSTSSLQQWMASLPPSSARVSLTLSSIHSVPADFNSTFTTDLAANLARGLQLNSTQSAAVHQFIHVISLQGCLSHPSRRRRRLLQFDSSAHPLQVELVILSTIESIGANWSAVAAPTTSNSSQTNGSAGSTPLTLTDIMTGMGSWLMTTVETGQFQANASHIQPLSGTVTTLGVQSSSSSSSSTGGRISSSSSRGVTSPWTAPPGDGQSASSSVLSSGAVAGIVVGVILFVVLALLLAVLVMRVMKRAAFSGVAMASGGDDVNGRYAGSEKSWRMSGIKAEAPTTVHWTGRTFS